MPLLPARLAPVAAVVGTALVGLALAGCGSSSTTSARSASSPTDAPATTAPASAAPATTVPTSGASGGSGGAQAAGMPLLAAGPVPAVTGASDLAKEPTIATGGATPPTTPTGKDLVVGTGAVASAADTVKVQYVGALYSNGTVFDASWTDDGPISFPLDGVVPGFKDAIVGMAIGGRREVVIPPAEAYGAAGSPPAVPPNATLVFVIDLLGITPGQ